MEANRGRQISQRGNLCKSDIHVFHAVIGLESCIRLYGSSVHLILPRVGGLLKYLSHDVPMTANVRRQGPMWSLNGRGCALRDEYL